jgi:hypothetical protein
MSFTDSSSKVVASENEKILKIAESTMHFDKVLDAAAMVGNIFDSFCRVLR